MQMNDHNKSSAHIHYSPTAKDSIGWRGELLREENTQLHTIQYNRLLKRWNMPNSQANTYLKLGLGAAEQDDNWDPAGTIGFAADYETQRIFVGYENRFLRAGDFQDGFTQSFRAGFAPYIGSYDDLHTWLMLDVEHQPEEQDNFIITPMARFFYHEYLAEIGVSEEKDVMLNWIVRF